MKKNNKAEIIGFIFMVIGAFLWISEDRFPIEILTEIYPVGQFVLWTGVLIWALGYMKKEREAKLAKEAMKAAKEKRKSETQK